MRKPDWIFDREQDWNALTAFSEDTADGARLAVVRGRRRIGKSVLVRALVEQAGGMYLQAVEGTAADQLRQLGADMAVHDRLPAPLELDGWERALDALLARDGLVVLDEVSYLVASDASLPSRLQRQLDARRSGPVVRLLLCGSALSVMSGLLVGAAPLRGRASLELPVHPFDHRRAAAFHGISDARLAVRVFAVLGGVPGYPVDLLAGELPDRLEDFDRWVTEVVLSPRRPLLFEARHLLDEPAVRDRALYLSVLAALGDGATTSGEVASRLRRPANAVAAPLALLADLRLVRRRDDPLRARRPTWILADPLLRLWAVVLRRRWPALEADRAAAVWSAASATWASHVLGPVWEELAREWTATAEREVGHVAEVGASVISDPSGRTRHEVDVVALDATSAGTRVAALGEAKARVVTLGDLERLRRVRALLSARGEADEGTRLLLFSLQGFARDVTAAPDVVLVDPERLYA